MKLMKKISYGLALPALGLLSACSNNVPACSDPQATDLVLEITDRELQLHGLGANETSISVDAIRTTGENDKTGAFDCAAELSINGAAYPITYTVEMTDDNRPYVTVYGL